MTNNESTSYICEEDELFDYIHNEQEKEIDIMLSKKVYPIWDYRSAENQNSTLLHTSVYKKNLKITKKLIDYCKDNNSEKLTDFINSPNEQGVTALHYASFRGDIEIIKLLIENGADIKKKTKRNLNIFHYCAQGNKPSSLMYFYLLLKEKDSSENYELIKEKDEGGSTALHWAVYSVAEDLLLYLINLDIFKSNEEKRNFINQPDNQGYSPLHLCITSKSSRIATKLLQNGADPRVKDKNGQTPLQLAIKKKQTEIERILKHSQDCNICNVKAPARQVKKSSKNIILVFLFQIIATFILLGSTFPIVLYKYNNNNENNKEIISNIFLYSYILLLLGFFIIYILLLIIDPGLIKEKNLEELKSLLDKNQDLTKYCYKCYVKKTRDSKHCIVCNRCYDKFDHHCYWINKCVAKRNFCLFLILLFETSIYLSLICFINILGLINIGLINEDNNDFGGICDKFKLYEFLCIDKIKNVYTKEYFYYHLILNGFLCLIILSFLIPEYILLVLHIYVCCSNYREEKRRRVTSSLTAESILDGVDNSLLISNTSSKV